MVSRINELNKFVGKIEEWKKVGGSRILPERMRERDRERENSFTGFFMLLKKLIVDKIEK